MTVKNKVVVITGASSGIGEATAKLLAKNGAQVMLGARREERLQKITQEIIDDGGQAAYRTVDVRDLGQVQNLVEDAIQKFGHLDVIFNNAGIMPNSPLSELKVQEWYDTIDINLKGVLNGIAAVLPTFTSQKSGQVIATSSVAGLKSFTDGAIYGATKWGVRDLMEVLHMESAQEGTNIRTATIYPSATKSELLDHISDQRVHADMVKHYNEAELTSEDVAKVVQFAIDQPEDVNISELTVYPTGEK
ncbi:SDR family oxidoreductase [Lactobacillus selangorensis]|uniref:SDR family oxidoreductase n=1 Tax=Lactobacillus selangorensis TaxID=81857 RepID=UPI00070EFB05|nr:SDR family oxidoreductase [Lactobacillus selangorensis]